MPGVDATAWKGKRLAILSDAGVPNRKILFAPTIVPQKDPFPVRWDAVYVGTGDREHPLVTPTSDKMFMVVDFDIGTTASNGPAASFAAGDFLPLSTADTGGVVSTALVTKRGWVRDLEPGEKVTGPPFVFNQRLRFGTYNPTAITSECLPPGEGRLNEFDALLGGLLDLNGDGVVSAADRFYAGTSRGYFSPLQTVIVGGRIFTIGFAGGGTFSTGGGPGGAADANRCKGKLFRSCLEGEVGVAQRTYWYMEPEQ
jgi:type IV pilus assembly protein PilY1